MFSLRTAYVHITRACQLRCARCYASAGEPLAGELDTAELRCLWQDLVALRPGKVVVTGGEPLLRADAIELLAALRDADPARAIRVAVNTNGRLVTRDLASRLAPLIDEARISVDGPERYHDGLRGRGSFELAMRAFNHLRRVGITARAGITVTASLLPHLSETFETLRDHGVTEFRLSPLRTVGRAKGASGEAIDEASVAVAVERAWRALVPEAPPRQPQPRRSVGANCGVGQYLNVMPDGEVHPCHVLMRPAFRLGNVRTDRLADMCGERSLLARLRALDFARVAGEDPGLAALAAPGACLGEVLNDGTLGLLE